MPRSCFFGTNLSKYHTIFLMPLLGNSIACEYFLLKKHFILKDAYFLPQYLKHIAGNCSGH